MYKRIFAKECKANQIELPDDVFNAIVQKIVVEKELELAAFQPRFLIEQIVASCRFMEQSPTLVPRFLNYAIDNLRVKRNLPVPDQAESIMDSNDA